MAASKSQPERYITEEEYLAFERLSETKHEYFNGRMWPLGDPDGIAGPRAMAGASIGHVRISGAVFSALDRQLDGSSCEPMTTDIRVHVPSTGLYTYPDVLVVCEPERAETPFDTITNPVSIIEVLSPSTQRYDRNEKLIHLRSIPTLRDYILVSQTEMHVEHYARRDDGRWDRREFRQPDDTMQLVGVAATLQLSEIYKRVRFDSAT